MNSSLNLSVHMEEWPTTHTFRISGFSWNSYKVVVVEIDDGVHRGQGEGTPLFYMGETVESMYDDIWRVASEIRRGINRSDLLSLMKPGGARNAVDCALWDLQAKQSAKSIWEITGISQKNIATAYTIGIEDTPKAMGVKAAEASSFSILKVKLDINEPVERVAAVRTARPDALLTVDANQAWTIEQLKAIAPQLSKLGVQLIEQPLPRGTDQCLNDYDGPIPLCADESFQEQDDLRQLSKGYRFVNVKLDKMGGLTESLNILSSIKRSGLNVLVGCMGSTSLSLAPTLVLGHLAEFVELDGNLMLQSDRPFGLQLSQGCVAKLNSKLWG